MAHRFYNERWNNNFEITCYLQLLQVLNGQKHKAHILAH